MIFRESYEQILLCINTFLLRVIVTFFVMLFYILQISLLNYLVHLIIFSTGYLISLIIITFLRTYNLTNEDFI